MSHFEKYFCEKTQLLTNNKTKYVNINLLLRLISFELFYLTQVLPLRVKVDLGVIAVKMYFVFPKSLGICCIAISIINGIHMQQLGRTQIQGNTQHINR